MPDCNCTQPVGQAVCGPMLTIASIINRFGSDFTEQQHPNGYALHVLKMLTLCKTAAMGGHTYRCDACGHELICYNSCRNRHCPSCQGTAQALWVDDRIDKAFPGRHYHLVFTVPHELNELCLLDSRWFFTNLFACVWDTLRTFGYSHYGAETGAICVLHTWGQNLSLHPHIHCLVPALGQRPSGTIKGIGHQGQYLYPVHQLSATFKGKFMDGIIRYLRKAGIYSQYHGMLDRMYKKPWVIFCEPSLASPRHVFAYLGQYIHRVAISNQRILKISDDGVCFRLKDYNDNCKNKILTLSGVEFLRRFCLHILPKGFVKIRYYGIYASRNRVAIMNKTRKMAIRIPESIAESIKRLTGKDVCLCPACKAGHMSLIETLPRIRAPASGLLSYTPVQ
jgi:hypothetical protein